MARKGFFSKLGGKRAKRKAEAGPDETNPPPGQPPEDAEQPSPHHAVALDDADEAIVALVEAIRRGQEHIETLAERLADTAAVAEKLTQASNAQRVLSESMQQTQERLAESHDDIAKSIRDLSEATEGQVELLQDIKSAASARAEADAEISAAVAGLTQAVEALNQGNAGLVAAVEGTRDQWDHANQALAKAVKRHERLLTWLVVSMFAIAAALVVFVTQVLLD